MKLNKLLLSIASVCLLAGCGDNGQIKPDTSTTGTSYTPSTTSMPDITSDYSSIYAGISEYELDLVFESAKESIINLTGSTTTTIHSFAKKNDAGERIIENHSITIKETSYENSVLVRSATASNDSEFEFFELYHENYGSLINSYTFLNIKDAKIESRNVYKKPNAGVNTVVKDIDVEYTPQNFETYFSLISSNEILSYGIFTDQVIMAGKFENGGVYVRFLEDLKTGTHTIEDEYGMHESLVRSYQDFLIEGGKISKCAYVSEEYIMCGEGNKTRIDVEAYVSSTKYETSSHGKFNTNNIPAVTVQE